MEAETAGKTEIEPRVRLGAQNASAVLYERRVAKPLSICNPDGDAFTAGFMDGGWEACANGGGKGKVRNKKIETRWRNRGQQQRERSPRYFDSKE